MVVEQLWQPVPGGSGSYVTELARALGGTDVRVTGLAARHPDGAGDVTLPVPVRHSRLPRTALYESWNRLRRPRAEGVVGPVDVVHATTWAVPGRRAPLVVTVHDLAFLREPEHFTARGNGFFRRALEVVREEAAVVVVPSEATRADCLAHGLEAGRLRVVPHGVRADAVDAARRRAFRGRFGLAHPYVLWCGTLEPRKNAVRLVEAFARARTSLPAGTQLVLVGPEGWGGTADAVARALAALPEGAVRLLGRLDHDDLQTAYAEAAAFAFPSLWEGFGMPVLEAMAHGVPVVTSRGTAMAEFLGDGGVLVDPHDVDSLAAGLVELLGPRHDARAAAARTAAAGRTWEASARAHEDAYRAAAGS